MTQDGVGPELLPRIEGAFEAYVRGLGLEPSPWAQRDAILEAGKVWRLLQSRTTIGAVVLTEEEPTLLLDILAIFEEHQGKGHGTAALDLIEIYGRTRNFSQIRLYTANVYPQLVRLYSGSGYLVEAVRPHPDGKDKIPRVHMTKTLA